MVISDGFKKTDIGTIPEEWEVIALKKITSLMTNGFVGTVKTHYTNSDDGILYIQGYNVEENTFNFHGVKRVTYEFHKQHLKSKLQVDDLLTVQTGDVGLTTIIPRALEGANCHALIITRFIKNKAYPKFYSFYFNSNNGRSRLKGIETGTTMKHINVGDMIHFQVPLPSLTEQQAIAEVLTDIDNLIQALEKQIAKKRLIKHGVMQKLLTPKEGWVKKKLGESSDIFRGGSPRPIESYLTTNQDGINWIKIGDVGRFAKFIESTEEKIIPEGMSRSRFVKEGDFLLSNSMSFGRPYIMKTKGCIHDGWLVIQNYQNHFDREFLYYVLGSESVIMQYKAMASGSSVLNLNKEIVKNVIINCPTSLKEQSGISAILSDIDIEINLLEDKLLKDKLIKQGLMQNLLTGKIRLL